jgi:hypothetical protein
MHCPPASTKAAFPADQAGNAILSAAWRNQFANCRMRKAAYVAGVVDGEGTISLVRHHGGENRRAAVSVANTELQLLTYLMTTIGAGRITYKRIAQLHHTPSFTYVIYSRQALALLRQITPYLQTYKRA